MSRAETLRIQYEHQLSSLQRQLEAERRSNQEHAGLKKQQYEQAVSGLQTALDQDQKMALDLVLTQLSQLHIGEIKQLQAEHQNDICLELTALKLSLEQVYTSKAEMEARESELKHEQRMEALNIQHREDLNKLSKYHKEELNKLSATGVTSQPDAAQSLTDQYNEMVKNICQDLQKIFKPRKVKCNSIDINGDTLSDEEEEQQELTSSQDIHAILQQQQEDISLLKSRLQIESEIRKHSSPNGDSHPDLEQQIASMQKHYEDTMEEINSSFRKKDEKQKQELADYTQQVETQQQSLKSHYEERISTMETSFETQISDLKDKYEQQISELIHSRLSDIAGEHSQDRDVGALLTLNTPQQREYVQKTMALTAVSDTDSDLSLDTSRPVQTDDYIARLKVLEAELVDRDTQLHELRTKVQREELSVSTVSSSTEQQLVELRQRVEDLQQSATEALAKCTALQKLLDERETEVNQLEEEKMDLNRILEEKDVKIHQLELEKAESEKLYRDLLERESPRSKGSRGRELHSGSTGSVDDSFASARDSIHDTPRSHLSDALDFTSPRSDLGYDDTKPSNNNADEAVDMCDSIPFANDSSDYQSNNGNNNNNTNNSSESASVEMAMEDLKRKVNELDAQLTAAKEREERITLQMEEADHKHKDAVEMLKQELDHERKIEVETLHSEFRVQLDVELKRQAAQLCPGVSANAEDQDTQSSNNNALPLQDSILESAHQPVLESDNCGENNIIVDPLLQTRGFDVGQALEEPITPLGAVGDEGSEVHENLSDDSKASTSPQGVPNPVFSSTPMPKRAQPHPLTDLEKEMEALRQEYEAKLSALKAEKEEAEDRYDRLMQGVQSGEHPELNQLMKDKYDEELELTKSLLQQEFDSQMKDEKKKFVEKHRKLMADFMEDREKEETESNKKHAEEMDRLRENLTKEYEAKLQTCEQENARLNRDLDLLRDDSQDGRDLTGNDSSLPEIEEITLTFQQQDTDEQRSASSGSWDGQNTGTLGTSTPQARPDSAEAAVQCHYEESEEETDAERAPTRQVRLFADVVKSPSPTEAHDMELKIQQLTSQVERLTTQLVQQQQQPQNGDAAKSPTRSPQHSPENDTLKDEDSALVAMLQSDLERISLERESVQRTNDRLLSLLSDSVKTYVGVEDTINRKLSQVVSGSTPRPPGHYDGASASGGGSGSRPSSRPSSRPASRPSSVELGQQQCREDSPAIDRRRATPDPDTSQDSHHLENTSILSNATDEGLEISQRLAESIFVGPDLDAEGEEILNDARSRLTSAVGQLLELMERSTIQLMEAKATQQELLDTLAARAQEMDSVSTRAQELDSQLAAEIQAKDYLGLELHKAEVEEQLPHSSQVDQPPALLDEVSSLNQEKRELSEQLQHQLDVSRKRLAELETLAEETERKHEAQVEEMVQQAEDLKLQLDNTERQLKASKAFVTEQMSEREQEREEHQREIEKLEEMIQGRNRTNSSQQRMQLEIADLNEQLHARNTSHSSMQQRTLELQRALEDKELSAHDLKMWVAQLENELDQRSNVEEQLKQRVSKLEEQLTQQQQQQQEEVQDENGTVQGQAASAQGRTDNPTLVSPPSSLRKPWNSQLSLEEEVLRSQKLEEELQQENNVLKDQVQQQLVQISGLRNQLDQLRHYGGQEADDDVSQLRTRLQTERDALERSEAQVSEAQSRIETLEELLKTKADETENIKVKVSKIMEIGDTQEENAQLKSQVEELQGQISQLSEVSTLPPELLEEKNAEIQDLRNKVQQQEQQQQIMQTRLKEKDEEISDLQDNISSLRRGEACLDVSLPLNDDPAGNMLNISMTGRTTRSARAVTPTSIQQELEDTMMEREGELAALSQELEELKTQLAHQDQQITDLNAEKADAVAEKDKVEQTVHEKNTELDQLTSDIESLRLQCQSKDDELIQACEERDKAQEQLTEKEVRVDQMILQIDSLQEEITSLTTFQLELQKDFDTVQAMLDDKEKEIESLTKELTDNKTQQDALDTVLQLEKVVASLQKELQEKHNVIEEKEEELYELRDKLEEMDNVKEEATSLKSELSKKDQELKKEKDLVTVIEGNLAKGQQALEELEQKNQVDQREKEEQVVSLQSTIEEKNSKIQHQEEQIVSMQKDLAEMQEKAQNETASLLKELEKTTSDYEKRILSIEEQLKIQNESYAALKLAADHSKTLENNVTSLTQMIQDKEAAIESLERKLSQSTSNNTEVVEDLKAQLSSKDKDLEKKLKDVKNEHEKFMQDLKSDQERILKDLNNFHEKMVEDLRAELASREETLQDVQRLLKEKEEQLRLRQTALLDAQAEKDELHGFREQLEEKDRNIAELEGQLRFRQSCILDMEAERERVLEERDDFEAELRQDLEEKEMALKDMQEKYTRLKESLDDEVIHMEQEVQRSSQARVVKTAASKESFEDGATTEDLKNKLTQALGELASLRAKEAEVEQRLAQTQLQLGEREDQIQQLQAEMQQQGETAASHSNQLETQLREAENRLTEVENVRPNNMELEELSEQQKRDLEEKAQQIEWLKEDIEKWKNMVSSQTNLQQQLEEKEETAQSLEKDLMSAQEELRLSQEMAFTLQEDLSAKEDQLAQLQSQQQEEEKKGAENKTRLKNSNQSLSPETKQSISHLKMQLRKAHAALEEMRSGEAEGKSGCSQEEYEKLKEELATLRLTVSEDQLSLAKAVQDLRETHNYDLAQLQEQHDEDVRKLRKLQEHKLEQALLEQRQALEKDHKTELNQLRVSHQAEIQSSFGENSAGSFNGGESSRSSTSGDESALPQRLQALLQRLNNLGEHLLSVSDLDYLQQHLVPEARAAGDTSIWSQERRALVDQIDALKNLLQQAEKVAKQGEDEKGDWRSDLLQALISVYERERRVLNAEVSTADSMFPEVDIISQLESRLHDLERVHQSGLDEMLSADRQSLLDEVDSLHHRLLEARAQLQDARDSLDQRISQLEDAKSSAEWKLQKQIELLEYKLQQEAVVQEDLRKSLRLERGRVAELSQQSARERTRALELQEELSHTQIGLSKARDALEREQQRFSSVTDALEEERAKTNRLAELLEAAKHRLNTVEKDVADADARYKEQTSSEDEYIQELKAQLDRERQRSAQFSDAEEEAKGQVVQLTDTLEHLKAKVTALRDEYEAKIEATQREHAEQQVTDQRAQLDSEAVSKLSQLLDEERESHQAALEQEKELNRQLRRDVDHLRSNHAKHQKQLESEHTAQVDMLRHELAHTRSELTDKLLRAEAVATTGGIQTEETTLQRLRAVERDREDLRVKVSELEAELVHVQERARQLQEDLESRSRDSVDSARQGHREAIGSLLSASVVDQELKYRLGKCCGKLQSVATQLQNMASQQHRYPNQEVESNEALDRVLSELDQLREDIKEKSALDEKTMAGVGSEQLSELTKHNQQLAERVVRLQQDKENLSSSLSLLQARLKASDGRGHNDNVTSLPQYVSDATSDEETVYDRTVWASERLSLQMALDSAEHEIQRLRGEIQQFRKSMSADGQLITVDHEKTTRLYGKFLRAESFRKALVYQKKYLLLLLGGYRDTEQETLAILASMGGFPSPGAGLGYRGRHSRAFTVFRSVGRTVIAIFRMKYLVRKWKRATRVGSPVMTGQVSHHNAYVPSSSSFPHHQRRHAGGSTQHSHQPQHATLATLASAMHHHHVHHSNSNNSSFSSSHSIDYVNSLSNGNVSSISANLHPAASRASASQSPLTPPTKELSSRSARLVTRGNRDDARRRILQEEHSASPRQVHSARNRHANNDDDNFLHYLEKVKQQLSEADYEMPPSRSKRSGWR